MSRRRRSLAWSAVGAAICALAVAGCGGGGGDADTGGAETGNRSIPKAAESSAEASAKIHEELDYRLAPYEYEGVDETFALPGENLCTIDGVYTSRNGLELHGEQRDTLLSPDGNAAVEIGTLQGTQDAPCLKAVAEALGWGGGSKEPKPSGPLTKAEYIRKADALCKLPNEIADFFIPIESYDEQAVAQSTNRLPVTQELEGLEALEPPASLESMASEYNRLLSAKIPIEDEAVELAARLGGAQSAGEGVDPADERAFEAVVKRGEANYRMRHKLAAEIGLKECANAN
jgi:hypothetical protein